MSNMKTKVISFLTALTLLTACGAGAMTALAEEAPAAGTAVAESVEALPEEVQDLPSGETAAEEESAPVDVKLSVLTVSYDENGNSFEIIGTLRADTETLGFEFSAWDTDGQDVEYTYTVDERVHTFVFGMPDSDGRAYALTLDATCVSDETLEACAGTLIGKVLQCLSEQLFV